MRFAFIRDQGKRFEVGAMCRALGVSASGYYAWRKRSPSRRSREDRALTVKIRAIHQANRKTYGSPRVYRELRQTHEGCGQNRVARLMRKEGLRTWHKRKFRVTTDSRHSHPVAPNRLARRFGTQQVDAVWLADITFLRTTWGWLYLAALMDLASRRIVGWALGPRITQALVLEALRRAVLLGRQPGLHHCDQGSQYAARAYQQALARLGIETSMSRRGNCWDNAPMESFFHTLKVEAVHGVRFESREQAQRELFDYIERFYNPRRLHSSLGYLSPAEFERQAKDQSEVLIDLNSSLATRSGRCVVLEHPAFEEDSEA